MGTRFLSTRVSRRRAESVSAQCASAAQYYCTAQGTRVARLLAAAVEACWGDYRGLRVAILSPANPALGSFGKDAERLVELRTVRPGRESFPAPLRVNVEAASLPVADSIFDRVLLLHALEVAPDDAAVLREVWRVTAPEGRVLVIASNRLGPWAWFGRSPFRRGRALTKAGLRQRLAAAAFEIRAVRCALYAPPLPESVYLRIADLWEQLAPPFCGAVLADGVKRLHLPTAVPGRRPARRWRLALNPRWAACRSERARILLGRSTVLPTRYLRRASATCRPGLRHALPRRQSRAFRT